MQLREVIIIAAKKLVFVTNFMNHYQLSLANEFIKIYGDDYAFIAEEAFDKERLAIGFRDMNQEPIVFRSYDNEKSESEAARMIEEAECVIACGVPVKVLAERLRTGRLTFMQSERFFKGPLWKDAVRFFKYRLYSGGRSSAASSSSKFYLLSTGGYAVWDYNTCGLFRNKAYKWAYFPECRRYDLDNLMNSKEEGSILWAGRFLQWKHPELALILAKNLKTMNLKFRLRIVGSGEMHDDLARMIESMNLTDCVKLMNALPVDEMRREMERTQIYLFTSDRGEGWGAVLNETMNSACAVIAGEKAGATPYLIKDGINGFIFRDKDASDLTHKVSSLLREPGRISAVGREAYRTMITEWNPEEAAKRFVKLSEALSESNEPVNLFDEGPCSIADVI